MEEEKCTALHISGVATSRPKQEGLFRLWGKLFSEQRRQPQAQVQKTEIEADSSSYTTISTATSTARASASYTVRFSHMEAQEHTECCLQSPHSRAF